MLIRKTRLGIAILAVTATSIVGWQFIPPRHSITEASYSRIRLGMSQKEIETILGAPAGDYTHGQAQYRWSVERDFLPKGLRGMTWLATEGDFRKRTDTAVFVFFDDDARVVTWTGGSQTYDAPWLAWLKRTLRF